MKKRAKRRDPVGDACARAYSAAACGLSLAAVFFLVLALAGFKP